MSKQLTKLSGFAGVRGPVLTIVMDGVGLAPEGPGNAVASAYTHVRRVSDAIQPSHPLSSPSPPAPNPSQHQSLFQ